MQNEYIHLGNVKLKEEQSLFVFPISSIAVRCLGCHNHSSRSLFSAVHTFCKMTDSYAGTIFKMTSSFGKQSENEEDK